MSILADEIAIRKNAGATIGTRRRLNLVEGGNITLTITDDPTDQEVDVSIGAVAGGAASSRAFNYIVYTAGGIYYTLDTTTGATTNNASFWTQMINTIAAATSGDHIYIRNGTYPTSAVIAVNKAVHIEGAGYQTTVIASGVFAGAIFRMMSSYSSLKNLYIDGDNKADYCVQIDNCQRVECYGLEIIDAVLDGIYIDNITATATTGHKIIQCISKSNGKSGVYVGQGQTDVWVSRCTLSSNARAGLELDASGFQSDHSHLWGNDVGYLFAPNHGTSLTVINGDYVEDNVVAEIYHGTYNTVACRSAYDVSIVNCMFWPAAHDIKNPAITGSLVYLDPPAGVYTSRWTMTGNLFNGEYGAGHSHCDYNLYLGARAINSVFTSNIFMGATTSPIYLGGGSNIVNHNEGFRTEAHGNAVILTGETHVHIPHGLPYIPALADFNINTVEEMHVAGNHLAWLALDGTGATNIIAYMASVEAEDISIVWHYIKTPF